ncbi:DUF1801 domain-containing protein [Flavobacterium sp. ACN6]|uniref:DUF1801 domain-containing protein n=1 Tax=Flavobacterium sp. ACN6 TaxID=1920426 RepID=UPI002738932F|nr:DUF1801 domain-containing protein [Flavobacterium sp. ACN6]
MRDIILKQDTDITNVLKYGMPFFCYKGKMFCYLWIHKNSNSPISELWKENILMNVFCFRKIVHE